VNAILRVPQIQRRDTQRIPNAARHLFRQVRITFAHLRWRVQSGQATFRLTVSFPSPVEALATDRNAVRVGAPVRQYELGLSAADIDHNRTVSEVVGEGDDWWRLWRDLRARPSVADVILSVGRAALALAFMNTRRPIRFSRLQQVTGSTKAVVGRIWPSLCDAHFHGSGQHQLSTPTRGANLVIKGRQSFTCDNRPMREEGRRPLKRPPSRVADERAM
jgi:hypothetical protein